MLTERTWGQIVVMAVLLACWGDRIWGTVNSVDGSPGSANSVLVPISRRPGEVCSVLFHPLGGGLGDFVGLAPFLARRGPVFGIRAAGLEPGEEPDTSINAMVDRYRSVIDGLSSRPNLFVGWSLGGILAWEIAAVLARRAPAPEVVLIDSDPRPWTPDANAESRVRTEILRQWRPYRRADGLSAATRTLDAQIAARRDHRVINRHPGRTLLVCCGADKTNLAAAWSELADDLTIRVLDCGHFEVFDRPHLTALTGAIGDFLAADTRL